ncbi:chaplin [Streptomyces sp. MB22_4]|uniref:chaplin n=1 Tax=unclassified Streptomyces TaxID=2593676 RepID=UPI0024A57C91|nr:chaplin [Streptomyces hygroscopicus]GLX52733.1 membrane protein [Streptomyces hygroscopicus subsp. hygroscopicus]
MRIRSIAATAVLAGAFALGGATGAFASDHDPTTGVAVGSPGFLSGNVFQMPIDIPVNICGDTFGYASLLNPAVGNTCVNQ